MATRKKTPVECQPQSRRDPRHETRTIAPSGRAPATQPGAGLSSAVLQLPLRLVQPRIGLSAGMAVAVEQTRPAPARNNISRLPVSPTPPAPSAGKHLAIRQRFGELRAALADGFEIVQPIFARPLWTVPDDSATAFNFVLTRERATRLVIVPEGRTIQRFIRERHLAVDYRR